MTHEVRELSVAYTASSRGNAQVRRLGAVCQLNPKLPANAKPASSLDVSFVPMSAVDDEQGVIRAPEVRPYSEVAKGYTYFAEGDVLFAKITPCMENGKAAIATNLVNGVGFGSTEFHVLRPTPEVLPEWIFYFIRQESFRRQAKAQFTGSAGQQRVPRKFLEDAEILIPPLKEQHRIVDILKRADGIRRLRKQAIQTARELIPALFVDMFGDPATNPRGWAVQPLGDLVDVVSGATPSKKRSDYWIGNIPWVSPKDMKVEDISDSEDHLAESVLSETNIKMIPRESVLVVVRGMILVHTVPIRINSVPVTINQDMKALIPKGVRAAYLRWALQSMHETLLKKVTTAGHGTRKLDTEHLVGMMIGVPPLALQDEFKERVNAAASIVGQHNGSREYMERLFQGLLHRAFRGEL